MNRKFVSIVFIPLWLASAVTDVHTEVSTQGTSSVSTVIINEVNGKKTTIEVNQPGNVRVETDNDKVKIMISPSPQVTAKIIPQETSEKILGDNNNQPKVEEELIIEKPQQLVDKILNKIITFFQKIFDF